MIKYFYKSLRSKQVQDNTDYKRGTWVYVENPSKAEVAQLVKQFDLIEGHVMDALDEEEMPRLEHEETQTYIFVRMPYQLENNVYDTVPVLFIFGGDFTITISLKRLPYIDTFLSGQLDIATTQRTKLVLQIMHQITMHYEQYITQTSKQIKSIRARLRGHEISNQDFLDFVNIEDELNEFLSALMPTNATLRRLSLGRYLPLFEEDQDLVEDLMLGNEQSIEACRANIKSIVNIRQAYSAISSNNLNRTIKILTIATVMISLPNIIFGMYGMNVSLPFQESFWAYGFVILVTLLVLIIAYAILRRKRIL